MGKYGEGGVAVPRKKKDVKAAGSKKRNRCPGVRAVGGRIYDSENGQTCHQCRQKTRDFAAGCKQLKKKGLCTIKYCLKCLLNRYGENAEEVAEDEAWTCPKCRGICNCSFCRKKNGEMPTGILAHVAKASGHSSVHELLVKGSDVVAAAQTLSSITVKANGTNKKRPLGTDDELSAEGDENVGVDLNAVHSDPTNKRLKKRLRKGSSNCPADEKFPLGNKGEPPMMEEVTNIIKKEIVLPRGAPVTSLTGAELEAEDIGAAIQFLEFCHSFSEFFQIRKGQPEKVLQDITGGGRKLRDVSAIIADLHINLLTIIQEDREEKPLNYSRDGDAWIIEVGKYICESKLFSKELPLECLDQGVTGYKSLSPSYKLRVLNFLCDETLSSAKLRNWIDDQNERAAERKSAAREKIHAAKEKEKELKERLKDDMARAMLSKNGENRRSGKINDLISKLKEAKEVKDTAINATLEEKLGGILRSKLVMVNKGVAYWKLDSCCKNSAIMSQEFDTTGNQDTWFMFTEEEEKVIEDYVLTRSREKWRNHTRF